MSQKKFDPKVWKNKNAVYVAIPNASGIYSTWDWNKKLKKYCKRTKGNKFYVVKRVNGRQLTRCFEKYVDAQKWKEEKSFSYDVLDENLTFEEVKERYLRKKESEVRVATQEYNYSKARHLRFFHPMPIKSITPKTVDAWLEFVKRPAYLATQHKTRVTYRHELSLLRQVLDYYGEYICDDTSYALPVKKRHNRDCIVDRQKWEMNKTKHRTKFLTQEQVFGFLNYLKEISSNSKLDEIAYVLGLFQLRTGTRIGEACAVDWKDLDLSNGSAFIHRNVVWSRKKGRKTFINNQTKTGDDRLVYFPQDLAQELKAWSLKSGRSKGLVFSENGFEPLKRRAVQYRYDRALKAIGAEWRGTHIMRHTFSTDFLEKTENPKALQGLLGHRHAVQTSHYAKITENLKIKGMDDYQKSLAKVLKI